MSPAVGAIPKLDFTWPAGIRGAVSLTFDDARPSQLDHGVPLFDRYGVKATFYVVPRAVAQRQADWRRAAQHGHECAGHTLSHPCSCNFSFMAEQPFALERMTLEKMEAELTESNRQIENLVGTKPISFAYPCGQKFVGRGETLQSYVPLVARHYLTGRGWRDEYFNAPDRCDLAQLAGIEFDGVSFDDVLPQLETAAQTGNWIIFAGHDIGPEPRRQLTSTALLEALCQYCRDPAHGLWLDTVGTIGTYIHQHRA